MRKAFKCVLPSVTNQLLILARADLASGCRAARLKQVGVRVGHESTRPRITLPGSLRKTCTRIFYCILCIDYYFRSFAVYYVYKGERINI